MAWPTDPARWLTPRNTLAAWVATTEAGELTGHVMVRRGAGPGSAVLSRFFVGPMFRGQAIGTALLRHAAARATAAGLTLTLDADQSRVRARALYERTGWRWTHESQADWTAPDGHPVTLHHYAYEGKSQADPA